MKYVKMLGLAAVAATALMAFVGASTASATVLCKTEGIKNGTTTTGTTCPMGWVMAQNETIHAVSEGVTKLTTSFKNIECNTSTANIRVLNEGSATETVVGEVEKLTFEECNCEVKVIEGGNLEIHWENLEDKGSHNGTVTSSGALVTAECSTIFGKIHCIYKTNATDVGTLTGSSSRNDGTPLLHVEGNNIPRLETSGLCAEKASWDATYTITTPDTLNVADHT